jgi:hypothetical protein
MHLRTLTLLTVMLALASCRARAPTSADSPESLPRPRAELLKFRNDSANPWEPGGLLATDSYQVYRDIDSYPMLHAVILDRRAESKVLPYAIERALLLAGPGKVFADVRRDAGRDPELFAVGPRRQLLDRSREPHVWVSESAFIDEADMPRADARRLFERMAAEVRAGAAFEDVYFRVQNDHSYDEGRTRLTRIGNYGDWVLSASKRTGEPFRSLTAVSAPHLSKLLSARPGDMLILEDDDDPQERRLILCYVREVYRPGKGVHRAVGE